MKYFLLIIGILATLNYTVAQCLQGNYTIGKINADYSTFQDAVNDLQNNGVCGPVIFMIDAALYAEQITIGHIPGASAVNLITFQSLYDDPDQVIIRHVYVSSTGYVVKFNNARHIKFKGIKFVKVLGSMNLLLLENSTSNISFQNCEFIDDSPPTFHYIDLVKFNNSRIDSVTFQNNIFYRGARAIFFEGVANSLSNHTIISNNKFHEQKLEPIYLKHQQDLRIIDNIFIKESSANTIQAIRIENSKTWNISKNIINDFWRGVRIINSSGTASNPNIFSNNIVNVKYASLNVSTSLHTTFCFNTLVTEVDHPLVDISYSDSTVGFFNNIMINNRSDGYIYYSNDTLRIVSERNVYSFNDTSFVKYITSQNTYSFNQWQLLGNDTSSKLYKPDLKGPYNAHVGIDSVINNFGFPIPGIVDDVDNISRDLINPDPGANEIISSTTIDVGITGYKNVTGCSESLHPSVYLKNYSNNITDTLRAVELHYSINNIDTLVNWKGQLAPGDSLEVKFPTYNYHFDSTYDLSINTLWPNYSDDNIRSNDTAVYNNFVGPLSGMFFINGNNADFHSIEKAFHTITTRGVCGSVTLKVGEGYYEVFLYQKKIPGTSDSSRVTLEGLNIDSSKVRIYRRYAPNYPSFIFYLDSTEYITFSTIGMSSSAFLIKNSSNIVMDRLNLDLTPTSYYFPYVIEIKDSATNITLKNSYLINEHNNFYSKGKTASSVSNILIENNHIESTNFYYAINMENTSNVTISNNTIHLRVMLTGITEKLSITGNKFKNPTIYSVDPIIIDQSDFSNPALVANNVFLGKLGKIQLRQSDSIHFFHNTINTTDTYLEISGVNYIRCFNNIFNIKNGFLVFINTLPQYIDIQSDYNVWYNSKQAPNTFGTIYGIPLHYNEIDLIYPLFGLEKNSKFIKTNFTDSLSFEIHLDPNVADQGLYLSDITTDFYGTYRDSLPDIGAYEFTGFSKDMGITAVVTEQLCQNSLQAVLQNYGSDTLHFSKIYLVVDSIIIDSVDHSNLINPKGSDTITFTIPVSYAPDKYNALIWHNGFNGSPDMNTLNDTLKVSFTLGSLSGIYSIGDSLSDFYTLNDAVVKLDELGICGPVTFNIKSGIYNEQIEFNEIRGSSKENLITFQSESGNPDDVLIQYSSLGASNYIISFRGASDILFQNCTFQPLDSFISRSVYIWHFSNRIKIKGNKMIGTKYFNYSTNDRHLRSNIGIDQARNIEIVSNHLYYGAHGIYNGEYSYFARIIDNTVDSVSITGINSRGEGAMIYSNNISAGNLPSNSITGISVSNEFLSSKTIGNKIWVNGYGIWYSNGTSIYDTTRNEIINNMIYTTGFGALQINSPHNLHVYHNTLLSENTNSSSAALYLGGSPSAVQNNIITKLGGGYALWVNTNTTNGIGHNNYYTSSNTLIRYLGNTFNNLSSWQIQTADSNSVEGLPAFVSNTNLYLAGDTIVGASGKFIPEVTTDIDGNIRKFYPELGAHEFTLPNHWDAGVIALGPFDNLCIDSTDILVSIANFGYSTIDSILIQVLINDSLLINYTWYGNLAINQIEDQILVGRFSFTPNSNYEIKAWTVLLNHIDLRPENDSIAMFFTTLPSLDLGPQKLLCYNDSILFQADTIYNSYSWSTGNSTSSLKINTPGIYYLTVTDKAYCKSMDTLYVIQSNGLFPVNLGKDTVLCHNETISFDVSEYQNIYWSTGDTTGIITIDTTINLIVNVSDSLGCNYADTIKVNLTHVPAVYLGPDKYKCNNDSISLFSSSSYSHYLWSTGATTPYLTVNDSGSFTVHVADINNCISADTVSVYDHPKIFVSLGSDTVKCPSDTIHLFPGFFSTYSWSTGATTPFIEVVLSGDYFVEVADSNGCKAIDSIKIDNHPNANIFIQEKDTILCIGSNLTLSASGAQSYVWEPSTDLSNNTGSMVVSIPQSTITYTLLATDPNNCLIKDSILIEVVSPPVIPPLNISQDTIFTIPGLNYKWYLNNQIINNATAYFIIPQSSGNYFVEVYTIPGCSSYSDSINYFMLSIDELFNEKIKIYPIPTGNFLFIDNAAAIINSLEIIDSHGKTMMAFENHVWKNGIEVGLLSSGLYWLKITTPQGIYMEKFIKQ